MMRKRNNLNKFSTKMAAWIIVLIAISFLSCAKDSDGFLDPNKNNKYEYYDTKYYYSGVQAQYPLYILTPYEKRLIFLKGNYSKSPAQPNITFSDNQTCIIDSGSYKIGAGDNKWAATNESGYNCFAFPIQIADNCGSGTYDKTLSCNGLPSGFTVKIQQNRRFKVNIYSMSDYNPANLCDTAKINDAFFSGPNSSIFFDPINTSWPKQVFTISSGGTNAWDDLFRYLNTRNFSIANDKQVILFGAQNYYTSINEYKNIVGKTFKLHNLGSTIPEGAFCVIFYDKIFDSVADPEERKGAGNWYCIHELGHGRGQWLSTTSNYIVGLTDTAHIEGHNGNGRNNCVMKKGLDTYYRDVFLQDILNPHFCEGHKQMLYNVDWTNYAKEIK